MAFWQENVGNSDLQVDGGREDGAPAQRLGAVEAVAAPSLAGAARRRTPTRLFGERRRHHAPDRRRHAVEVQGDGFGRAGCQFY